MIYREEKIRYILQVFLTLAQGDWGIPALWRSPGFDKREKAKLGTGTMMYHTVTTVYIQTVAKGVIRKKFARIYHL